jgi:hypothetical protein
MKGEVYNKPLLNLLTIAFQFSAMNLGKFDEKLIFLATLSYNRFMFTPKDKLMTIVIVTG